MIKKKLKYFISPMSKDIVDSVLDFNRKVGTFGFIPTRRQIDYNSGYVNNWDTPFFNSYVGKRVPIMRDHAGPDQGIHKDDGYYSISVDAKNFDSIHIDPWIKHPTVTEGLEYTVDAIKLIYSINPFTTYEVLTEQAIRYFSVDQMNYFLEELQNRLEPNIFNNIDYAVIQSGVSIDLVDQKNTGKFSLERFYSMIEVCNKFKLKSKEHNGDYLDFNALSYRFKNGLDSLNIGPEIAQIETLTILENLNDKDIDKWYGECIISNKWKRWQTDNFDIDNKYQMIKVCGHYTRTSVNLPNLSKKVKYNLTLKLEELYEASR